MNDNWEWFSRNYFGHDVHFIEQIYSKYRSKGRKIIWLIGDSVLDNKYWVSEFGIPDEDIVTLFDGQQTKKDIAYWINFKSANMYHAINCAVEAQSLYDKLNNNLTPQDNFVTKIFNTS